MSQKDGRVSFVLEIRIRSHIGRQSPWGEYPDSRMGEEHVGIDSIAPLPILGVNMWLGATCAQLYI